MRMFIHCVRRIGEAAFAAMVLVSGVHAGFSGSGPYITLGGGAAYYADATGTPVFDSGATQEREALSNFLTGNSDANYLSDGRYRTTEESGFSHNANYSSTAPASGAGLNLTITWDGPAKIHFEKTWLYVRDGKGNPGDYRPWYAFNLGNAVTINSINYDGANWDGKSTIRFYDFYISDGTISHASIFSGGDYTGDGLTEVPEPASVVLWLTTMVGGTFAARRRRRSADV